MQSFKALRVSRHQISAFIIALFLFVFFFPMDAAHSDIGPITRAPVQDIRPDTPIESDEEASTNVAWFDMDQVRRGLTYDKLKIRPRYRQEFELDSNILLESGNDAKSDIIFREIPGIHVAVPVHDHYLSADYEARLNQFVRHPRENSEDQRFNFEGGLNFTDMYLN
ncbi:MAG: hypothetical protein HY585_05450, partial [Candidatus Omnitrophica bacterium]|nr:hypothetical protein [Candidatus Omnitrophota bacterium]